MPYSPSPHASENRARLWVTALGLCVSWASMRSPIFKPNLERLSHDMHSSDLYVSSVQQADNGPIPTAVADHKNIQRFIGLEAVCERCEMIWWANGLVDRAEWDGKCWEVQLPPSVRSGCSPPPIVVSPCSQSNS